MAPIRRLREATMDIQGMATVLPVDDVAEAAAVWAQLLGAAPSFVDGDRWAQFDVGGRRLALAGTDRVSNLPGLMIKVSDLAEARARAEAQGLTVGPVEQGPHEMRCLVEAPGGWPVVLYSARTV
jgi:hypothetical protein